MAGTRKDGGVARAVEHDARRPEVGGAPAGVQRRLTPRRTALLASALLFLVVVPVPLTVLAALPAAPLFVYALVSLPDGVERTVALLSAGLAVLVPVAFLLAFA
jgi:hypothetical protein